MATISLAAIRLIKKEPDDSFQKLHVLGLEELESLELKLHSAISIINSKIDELKNPLCL